MLTSKKIVLFYVNWCRGYRFHFPMVQDYLEAGHIFVDMVVIYIISQATEGWQLEGEELARVGGILRSIF